MQKNDELSILIEKQLYSNAWSSVTVFISTESAGKMTELNSYKVCAGRFEKDGVYYSKESGIHQRLNAGYKNPTEIKIIRRLNDIYLEYKEDGIPGEQIKICQIEKEDYDTEYVIGFAVNLGNSVYYEWTFSNYINTFARPHDSIPADYIVNPHKDWCIHTFNPLIDYHWFSKKDLGIIGLSWLEYVKLQINLDNYVEAMINDNMNLRVSDEKEGKFFHQNLIYGYDDDKECLYTLFYNQGQVFEGIITYDEFNSERNAGGPDKLYMMHYNPCSEHFALYPERILQLLIDYRDSQNSALYEAYYHDGFMTGYSVFQYFINGDGEERLYSDIRVIFLLYEKALCNRDRMEYMCARGFLAKDELADLMEIMNDQIGNLRLIMNKYIKKRAKGELEKGCFKNDLVKMAVQEKTIVNRMIEILRKYV